MVNDEEIIRLAQEAQGLEESEAAAIAVQFDQMPAEVRAVEAQAVNDRRAAELQAQMGACFGGVL